MDMTLENEKLSDIASEIPYSEEIHSGIWKNYTTNERNWFYHFCLSLGQMKTEAQVRFIAFITIKYVWASQQQQKDLYKLFSP